MWRESWRLFCYGKRNESMRYKMYYTIKRYDVINKLCIIRINYYNVLF